MPWLETNAMDQRQLLVFEVERMGVPVARAARLFGVSRKTAHKWLKRYREYGFASLADQSRAPKSVAQATPEAMVRRVVELRKRHRRWGPKKLRALLLAQKVEGVPAASTIGDILKREGLIEPRRKRRAVDPSRGPLSHADKPNALWSVDFKGQFCLKSGEYCYPLTITDNYSRFILGCTALPSVRRAAVGLVFDQVFSRFGLPTSIRSDNGPPFATNGLGGFSRLTVWWTRLGIRHERIEPGKPQQNGRHERMHLTLKQETTRPAAESMLAQQERFDLFVQEFNAIRPHEALGQTPPEKSYTPSTNSYVEPKRPDYSRADVTRKTDSRGTFHFDGKPLYLGKAFAGEYIGLTELEDDCWLVSFCDIDVGIFNRHSRKMAAIVDEKVSHRNRV